MLPFDYISKYTQIYFTFHGSTQNIKKENRMKIIITHPIQINNFFISLFIFCSSKKSTTLNAHSFTDKRSNSKRERRLVPNLDGFLAATNLLWVSILVKCGSKITKKYSSSTPADCDGRKAEAATGQTADQQQCCATKANCW